MTKPETTRDGARGDLIARVAGADIALSEGSEQVWLEVIRKMDEVYADLIVYESDLEKKNGELEEAQTFIQSVIASVSDVLVVCDESGAILQINPAFRELMGHDEQELVGSSLIDLFVAEDRAEAKTLCAAATRETTSGELRFRTSDGPSDLMAINRSPLFDAAGRRAGAVFTGRPIGELRRAYEALHLAHVELKQAQSRLIEQEKMASLGRLVAGVAHELNNPISFVYGNIHTLDRYRKALARYLAAIHSGVAVKEREKLRRAEDIDAVIADLEPLIEGTLEGAVRISDIVKNLRRLSFGAKTPREPVALAKVVETATQWAARSKKAKARIVTRLEPDLLACGHSGQIHSVLVNLIDNALDAVRDAPAPLVEIVTHAEGSSAVVEVIDNGKGVPDALRSRVFEPFFTTKTVGEGTGLGLWISYSIVHEHGGSIEIDAPPSGGARFTLRLPRATD
ncbi:MULTISPECIES: sensor histidine kinase [Methylosinus]|uniref:histidine kinase n=1 Tax=Methylosinus trichosporium (strain ATCC 35070 / NCIMB 11131 / UNIQEM 75 / OB3b) TaxID=595536 RepID=A0A2D2CWB3_METT3|nr:MULTISPECIES: ATP-binding protein [Methylosinus]ATQ67072.1 PAS domain-containing sensor histidine kinase [Methylosinus trichosporium OB3b]OBS51092.1 PAS domain-containing sensor histidine kinase [Methylosinus sp. 3S-1]